MSSFDRLVARPLFAKTGFPLVAEASGVQLLKGRIWAEAVRLENPPEFPVRDFLDVASLSASVRWRPSGKNGLSLSDMTLDVRRLTGVRTRKGAVNFARFRDGLESREPGGERSSSPVSSGTRVDRLTLRLETVEIIDYFGHDRARRSYAVGFQQTFENRALEEAAGVLLEGLASAGVSRADAVFASLLPEKLWQSLSRAG